jgi:hypothetical protein
VEAAAGGASVFERRLVKAHGRPSSGESGTSLFVPRMVVLIAATVAVDRCARLREPVNTTTGRRLAWPPKSYL